MYPTSPTHRPRPSCLTSRVSEGEDVGRILTASHNTDTPEVDTHNTDTPEVDTHNTDTPEVDTHNTDTPEVDTHQALRYSTQRLVTTASTKTQDNNYIVSSSKRLEENVKCHQSSCFIFPTLLTHTCHCRTALNVLM